MSLIKIDNLTHCFGDKVIFNKANLTLFNNEKIGLVGLNGTGKSTLMKMINGDIIYDEGKIIVSPKVNVGYLDQHASILGHDSIKDYLRSAFKNLYDIEKKVNKMSERLESEKNKIKQEELLKNISDLYEHLDSHDFYSLESEIDKVASGLGIASFGINASVKKLSGGQRAKVMLAKLLLENPDVLMLDEPTNFLDSEHIEWLSKYIKSYDGAAIIISHDTDFIDNVTTCIADIENNQITKYNMKFDKFLIEKGVRSEQYIQQYKKQQKYIKKLEEFIDKNIARASTSNMAKSRRKTLNKLEIIEKPNVASKPTFLFEYRSIGSKILLEVKGLVVGWTKPLLPAIDLSIEKGEKLAVKGFNGIGKSTFLKTLAGKLNSISGDFKFATACAIEYFDQDNFFDDESQTPLEYLRGEYPLKSDKELRGVLSRCGLKSEHVQTEIKKLSGGERAKTTIARLTLSPCNVLILDEPTNHLDINTLEALKNAIRSFEGSIIFVSHDNKFIEEVADKVLDMEKLFS